MTKKINIFQFEIFQLIDYNHYEYFFFYLFEDLVLSNAYGIYKTFFCFILK